jgi:hypothetical protein
MKLFLRRRGPRSNSAQKCSIMENCCTLTRLYALSRSQYSDPTSLKPFIPLLKILELGKKSEHWQKAENSTLILDKLRR